MPELIVAAMRGALDGLTLAEALSALEVLTVAVGAFLVVRQLHYTRKSQYFDIVMQAESDFDELNKLMLTDRTLRDTYRLDDPVLHDATDEHLKKFVFYESYYAHLARLHLLLMSDMNPFRDDERSAAFWSMYRNVARYFWRDPVFRQVHASAREMKTFPAGFVREIDRIAAEHPAS